MIAVAVIMTIPDAHLLFPVGRADARIHVEQNSPRGTPS